jgi:hypothetical protein
MKAGSGLLMNCVESRSVDIFNNVVFVGRLGNNGKNGFEYFKNEKTILFCVANGCRYQRRDMQQQPFIAGTNLATKTSGSKDLYRFRR